MAMISDKLNNIITAIFGKDVRQALHDGLDAVNKETENTTARQQHLEGTFDKLVINAGESNAEIVDARVKSDGTSFNKLGDRIDNIDAQLEEIVQQSIPSVAHTEIYFMSAISDSTTQDATTDDCSLIMTKDNKAILVDCGEYGWFDYYDKKLTALGITKLDSMFITHSHSDHVGNAEQIIAKYKPSKLYIRTDVDFSKLPQVEVEWKTKEYHDKMIAKANLVGCTIASVTNGLIIPISEKENIKAICKVPDYTNYNNCSVAYEYTNGLVKVLFVGDLEDTATDTILSSFSKVDIAKLGHHGVIHSSNFNFLEVIKPEIAIVNNQGISGTLDNCDRVRYLEKIPVSIKDNGVIAISILGGVINHSIKEVDNRDKLYNYNGAGVHHYYFKENGKLAKNEFISDGLTMKWFTGNSQLVKSSFIPYGSKWVYGDVDGNLSRSKFVQHTNSSWYYLKDDYTMADNETLIINGKSYTFASGGACTNYVQ